MEPPPFTGDPYDYVSYQATNFGAQGVTVGWDTFRHFFGAVAGQAWDQLDIIENGGVFV